MRKMLLLMATTLLVPVGLTMVGSAPPASASVTPLTSAYIEISNDLAGLTTTQSSNVTVTFNPSLDQYSMLWGSGGTEGNLVFSGPLQVGQPTTPNLTVSASDDGCNLNGQPAATFLQVDQLQMQGNTVVAMAAQFACANQPLDNLINGTVAFNVVPTTPHQGYNIYGQDGALAAFGNDAYLNYLGDLSTVNLNQPIVGMATTADGGGYWMVATDGGIFNFGDAPFYGSTGAIHLNKPIVGMAATPSGHGYWLVASDGGIFSYGDAQFYGSTGAIQLNKPIVGMAATPSGHGYWLVASDGGIFSYGDAQFYGSTGAIHLNKPIVGMARTADGAGYWLVATDGGIFTYGDASFHGSTGAITLNEPINGMLPTQDGGGYWLVASDGGIFNFGDAGFSGSLGGTGITDVAGITS